MKHKIAVVGLGYVGLPLAIEFAKQYPVLGFDINTGRIEALVKGEDVTKEADIKELKSVTSLPSANHGLRLSSHLDDLKDFNTYIVTVPTPIDQFKAPDLRQLLKASQMLGSI